MELIADADNGLIIAHPEKVVPNLREAVDSANRVARHLADIVAEPAVPRGDAPPVDREDAARETLRLVARLGWIEGELEQLEGYVRHPEAADENAKRFEEWKARADSA